MSQAEKPVKISKFLRQKAQEFLSYPENPAGLMQIVKHFESGADTASCLLALDLVFSSLIRDRKIGFEVAPLKTIEKNAENDKRKWLIDRYEECYGKVVDCMEHDNPKVSMQAISTAMNLLAIEGRCPLVHYTSEVENYFPVNKLKSILMKLLSDKKSNTYLINKQTEYFLFDDVLFYTWKLLPSLTAKTNPNEYYIVNYLSLLERLQIHPNTETKYLCSSEPNSPIIFEETLVKKNLNKVWQCLMLWEHTPQTHRQLLVVLLEKVLVHLDKPLLLTDFLMDSLDMGGPVSLLALQGIFTMIQVHNLDYPNIFAKLYSMFEPEIFHTKYKARLFYLSDLFLSSTYLPEILVAAFAKRLARLALLAPSEDIIIICQFIGNLILRHPGLKRLLHNDSGISASMDPYIMEERDPLKSYAINSSLWELQTLQSHVQPSVANAARFIASPLPSVEWDIGKVLENTGDDVFDREVKKMSKLIILQFEQPNDGFSLGRGEKVNQFWEFS
ncbi:nucleolar complex protein 4 homolog B [Euwallacea fornicatus]|uniref:nucleolar complex protein 4 homolog B n=1 Tax=Euwallacea fornicatus TaxID=995702 RepID=UPI00338E97A2